MNPRRRTRAFLAKLGRPHGGLILFTVAFAAKEYRIVDQLGQALHQGGGRLVLSTLALVLIACPVLLLRPGRRQALGLLALDAVLTVITFGDLLHYRAFGSLTTVGQLEYVGLVAPVLGAVVALIHPLDALLFLDLAALLVVAIVGPSERMWPAIRPRRALVWGAAGAAVMTITTVDSPRFDSPWLGTAYLAGDIGLVNYHVLDIARWMDTRVSQKVMDDSTLQRVRSRIARYWNSDSGASPWHGYAKGDNVIVVQLESFQGFVAGLQVDGQPVTPNLDRLAAESMWFPHFFHQIGSGNTSDAQFVATCSLYSKREGAIAFTYASDDLECLPSIARDAGYSTVFLHADAPDFWNRSTFNPKQGFSTSFSDRDFVIDETIGLGLSDESFFRQAMAKLRAQPEPFYALLLTLTSHGPFDFPGVPQDLRLGELEGTPTGAYLQAVHYTDRALGQFVEGLRTAGILDRSVLVVYGDHQALKRSEPSLATLLGIPPDDELAWMRVEKRVPMLIRLPGGAGAATREQLAGQVDLPPTLLGLLGLPARGAPFLGHDLLAPGSPDRVIFPRGSVLTSDALFLSSAASLGQPRCYGEEGERPIAACRELQAAAAGELAISRAILENDLVTAILQAVPQRNEVGVEAEDRRGGGDPARRHQASAARP